MFEGNCIFAGVCAPQVFVYSPGMYSSSNQDFVRGTVSSFYEMFKQVSVRRTDENDEDEDEFAAFVFSNETRDNEKVSASFTLASQRKIAPASGSCARAGPSNSSCTCIPGRGHWPART